MRLYEKEPKTILLVEDSPDDERLAVRAIKQIQTPLVLDVVRDACRGSRLLLWRIWHYRDRANQQPDAGVA